jgi:hypothetical protein
MLSGGAPTSMVKTRESVSAPSVTVMVAVNVPGCCGVPESVVSGVPVGSSERPGGSGPEDQA